MMLQNSISLYTNKRRGQNFNLYHFYEIKRKSHATKVPWKPN